MQYEISQHMIDEYRANGYVIVEDFLDNHELETWRNAVDEAVARRGRRKLPDRETVGSLEDDEEFYEKVFTQRLNLWMDNEKIRALILDERIGRMACDLAGIDGIRIWHDQALIKPPWGNPTAWHLDTPYWSFYSRNAISIWVALDDAALQNGCMFFMPGTHKETTYDNPGITDVMDSLFDFYPRFRDREPVAAEMKAGSCSFHNGLLVHGAGANMTPYPRRAMTCAFMPEGAVFNGVQNILSETQVATLNVGDLLDDDKQNPLIFSRRK